MTKILTDKGWIEIEGSLHDAIDEHNCSCGEPAITITNIGTEHKPILWAQCDDCCTETQCDSKASAVYEDQAYGRD